MTHPLPESLPELPEPVAWRGLNWSHSNDAFAYRDFDEPLLSHDGKNLGQALYTAEQMHAYTRAALAGEKHADAVRFPYDMEHWQYEPVCANALSEEEIDKLRVRQQALEEAATLCDAIDTRAGSRGGGYAGDCADAIRALSAPQPKEQG